MFLFSYYRLILYLQEHLKLRGCTHNLQLNTLFLLVETKYHCELERDLVHVRLIGAL